MMYMQLEVVVWLVGWSAVGSILGFFTIRNKPHWTLYEKFKECTKSIAVGIFFAFPTFMILSEKETFSISTNVMMSGSVAFVITDTIVQLWPKLVEGSGALIHKIVDKIIGKI